MREIVFVLSFWVSSTTVSVNVFCYLLISFKVSERKLNEKISSLEENASVLEKKLMVIP